MKYRHILIAGCILAMTGCSTMAPQYPGSFDNTQKLKNSGTSKVAVGVFRAASDKVNQPTIRGGAFSAPTNGSYAEYLQKALEQELYDANRLDKASEVKIGGVLLVNEMDASGINVGTAHMEAEFIVRDATKERYRKTHSASIEWPSSFMGNIAIPRAIKEYPRVVQELLGKLVSDPDFIDAIK